MLKCLRVQWNTSEGVDEVFTPVLHDLCKWDSTLKTHLFLTLGTRERTTSYCRDRDMQMSHSLLVVDALRN